MKSMKRWLSWSLGAVLVPFTVLAADLVIPHVFTAGAPIVASEMNENFAAVKAAVDTKEGGGTRLKRIVAKSADGASMPLFGNWSVYDTQLGIYCSALPAADKKVRCLPSHQNPYTPEFGSAVAVRDYFSDAGCTSPIKLGIAPTDPGYSAIFQGAPPETLKYAVEYSSGQVVHQLGPRYTGAVFESAGGPCQGPLGETFYTVGPVVPPSTFAELTTTLL